MRHFRLTRVRDGLCQVCFKPVGGIWRALLPGWRPWFWRLNADDMLAPCHDQCAVFDMARKRLATRRTA